MSEVGRFVLHLLTDLTDTFKKRGEVKEGDHSEVDGGLGEKKRSVESRG